MKSEVTDFVQFWTKTSTDIALLTAAKPFIGQTPTDGWDRVDTDDFDAALTADGFAEGQRLLRHLKAIPAIISAKGMVCDLEAELKATIKKRYWPELLEKLKAYAAKYFGWTGPAAVPAPAPAPTTPPVVAPVAAPVLPATPAAAPVPVPTTGPTPSSAPPATPIPVAPAPVPGVPTQPLCQCAQVAGVVAQGNVAVVRAMASAMTRSPSAPPPAPAVASAAGPALAAASAALPTGHFTIPRWLKWSVGIILAWVLLLVPGVFLLGQCAGPNTPAAAPSSGGTVITPEHTAYTLDHKGEIKLRLYQEELPPVATPAAGSAPTPAGPDCD